MIPAQWERADKFYAGYAMVVDDIRGEALSDDGRMYKAYYRIIDESGQTVGDFYYTGDWTMGGRGYMGQKIYPYRFGENDMGLFGHVELKDADTGALLYVKFYINGEVEYIDCPQFIIKTENNIYTRYNIGTFRNGTANIYKFTGTESLSMTGEGNWSKRQAIASITVDGEVLDEINPDSEWKQDTTGWWYQNGDGTYPTNQWKEIAGKQYYFGADGYMLSNTTTPDGYTVGPDGAWIQDGARGRNKV